MNKEEAIRFLEEEKGLIVTDVSTIKYFVTDPEYPEDKPEFIETDKDLIRWAKELREDLNDE